MSGGAAYLRYRTQRVLACLCLLIHAPTCTCTLTLVSCSPCAVHPQQAWMLEPHAAAWQEVTSSICSLLPRLVTLRLYCSVFSPKLLEGLASGGVQLHELEFESLYQCAPVHQLFEQLGAFSQVRSAAAALCSHPCIVRAAASAALRACHPAPAPSADAALALTATRVSCCLAPAVPAPLTARTSCLLRARSCAC